MGSELYDYELLGESLALLILPYASEEMLKRESVFCSNTLLFIFHKLQISSNEIQVITIEGERIELLQVKIPSLIS